MDEKTSSVISARLKELRTDLSLTQKEFAQKINASTVSISSYEIGAKTPSLDMLIKISNAYNVSLSWVCGLTERKSINKVFNTYIDIIDMFFDIMNIAKLNIYLSQTDILNANDMPTTVWGISFTDKHLNEFLKDWNKMRELYWAGTIDEEVYSLWREKTISKYNIPIEAELH